MRVYFSLLLCVLSLLITGGAGHTPTCCPMNGREQITWILGPHRPSPSCVLSILSIPPNQSAFLYPSRRLSTAMGLRCSGLARAAGGGRLPSTVTSQCERPERPNAASASLHLGAAVGNAYAREANRMRPLDLSTEATRGVRPCRGWFSSAASRSQHWWPGAGGAPTRPARSFHNGISERRCPSAAVAPSIDNYVFWF